MIQRSARTGNFTILGNGIFTDNVLSFEAMGLLAYLLSKPDNWSIHPRALSKATEGSDQRRGMGKIYDLLNVLIAAGYVLRFKRANGEVDYIVYDEPVRNEAAENPNQENPNQENPNQENPNQENPNQENPNQENPNQDFPDVLINTEGQQELNLSKDGMETNARGRATSPPAPPPLSVQPFNPLTALMALGVPRQLAGDWLAIRKAKRVPLTQSGLETTVEEAAKAGISLAEAVKQSVDNGWAGFKAKWGDGFAQRGRTFEHRGGQQQSAQEYAAAQAARVRPRLAAYFQQKEGDE